MGREYRKHGGDPSHSQFPHGIYAGWKASCRCEKCLEAYRSYYRNLQRKLRASNPVNLEKDKLYKRAYRRTPTGRAVYANANIRYKKRRNATEHNHLLNLIYAARPNGFQVDHITPLSKKGAHHPDNLQYLPSTINTKKAARLDFDCGDAALNWRDFVDAPSTTRA